MEISGKGRRSTVVITDDRGNVLDTFSGSAAAFQASGKDSTAPRFVHAGRGRRGAAAWDSRLIEKGG